MEITKLNNNSHTAFKARLISDKNVLPILSKIDTFECLVGENPTSLKKIDGRTLFDKLAEKFAQITEGVDGEFKLVEDNEILPDFLNVQYMLKGKTISDVSSLPMMPNELKPNLKDNGNPLSSAVKNIINQVIGAIKSSDDVEVVKNGEKLQKIIEA